MNGMQGQWGTKTEMMQLLKRLVSIDSIVGTDGEKRMGEELVHVLKEHEYFRQQPEKITRIPIPDDSLGRFSVAAIYQGDKKSKQAFVLLSHFDVVGVEDTGRNRPFIFDIEKYTEVLKKEELPDQVKKELESGDWLAGRGVMDMKAGLVAQLAVLGDALERQLPVNIIVLSVPDEERNSEGMLSAVNWLADWKDHHHIEDMIGVCSEPSFSSYPGDETNYIYTGSAGKMLPFVCAVGLETHVGEPLAGVNASWMIAEVVSELELAAEFQENVDGEQSPLPTILRLADLKKEYDVQTPLFAYASLNVLVIKQTAEDVILKIKKAANSCAERIHKQLEQRYAAVEMTSRKPAKPTVYSYGELLEEGKRRFGREIDEAFKEVAVSVKQAGGDSRDLTIAMAQVLATFFKDQAPFYIVLLAPPFYPSVQLNNFSQLDQRLKKEVRELIQWAKMEYTETIVEKAYFSGLSDVSYSRLSGSKTLEATLTKEMPALGKGYHLPFDAMKRLNMSTVNIGPFGKDAHKWTERLYTPYFTNITPFLISRFIENMLKK